jgi:hypothetical protein
MHDHADRANRNPNRHPRAVMPLSRATVQMWGLEQLKDSSTPRRPRRKPLRAVAQWIAAALGR